MRRSFASTPDGAFMSIAGVALRKTGSLSGKRLPRFFRYFPRAMAWLFGGVVLSSSPWPIGTSEKLHGVAFWYVAQPPLSGFSQFDWVVLDPAQFSAEDIFFLRGSGSCPFAYLAFGKHKEDGVGLLAGPWGLCPSSLARRSVGTWQWRGLDAPGTLRLGPELGWSDLVRLRGVADVWQFQLWMRQVQDAQLVCG